ncbi:hypothetical protein PSAC2689_210097 [Paraburkholderia sacchari]
MLKRVRWRARRRAEGATSAGPGSEPFVCAWHVPSVRLVRSVRLSCALRHPHQPIGPGHHPSKGERSHKLQAGCQTVQSMIRALCAALFAARSPARRLCRSTPSQPDPDFQTAPENIKRFWTNRPP